MSMHERCCASLVLVAVLALLACGDTGTGPPGDDGGGGEGEEPTASAIAIVSGDGQTGTVGQALSRALVVEVTTSDGTPAGGVAVEWAAAAGSVSPATATTGDDGRASTEWTLGTAAGEQTATATVADVGSETFTATAVPGAPESVVVSPAAIAIDAAGEAAQLDASVTDRYGNEISSPALVWSSSDTAVATVDDSGAVTGVAAGEARIVARADQRADTATVGVLGPSSLLSTAFASGESATTEAGAGERVVVPVTLDMRRVSANGDLGSVEFELRYDPAVLAIDSAESALSGGTAVMNVSEPGTFEFAFAGTEPQGSAELTLARVYFTVAADASAGSEHVIRLVYPDAPSDTDFNDYSIPITLDRVIRVVAP